MALADKWSYVSSKLGPVEPATRSIAHEVYDAARAAGHEVWFMWGKNSTPDEHGTGRAIDFMVRNYAAGEWIRAYVWKHRVRLRLQHVIWWQSITSTTNRPGVRRGMADRGNSTANHKDHPHILVNPGAYKAPSGSSNTNQEDDDMPSLTDIKNAVWGYDFNEYNKGKEYALPKESAGRRLRRTADISMRNLVLTRRNAADIAGLQAAVKALSKSQGLDERAIQKTITDATAAALKDVQITLAVPSDDSAEA